GTSLMKARYLSLAPFIHWQHTPRPIPWAERFGRDAPLQIEIGFGNGEFLVRQAQTHPDQNFVGIEVEWQSLQRCLRKTAQAGLTNVRLLQIDARVALERLFLPQSVHRAYALFPCPWPKERHAKFRLFSHGFLRLLNSRLTPHSEAQLVTDHRPYMEWVLEQAPGTGFEVQCDPIPPSFSTKYERKWRDQGQQQFYQLQFTNVQSQPLPLIEDIVLQTHRVDHFDPDRFQPVNELGLMTIKFRDFIYDPVRQRGMVWVLAVEDGLMQEFWIEMTCENENRWHIRPARGCPTVPTMSVQRALDLVRDAALQPAPRKHAPETCAGNMR
ncbi:MAG: tRNA (guanosine(46)-N7)-methyltransferase TrmB, partial [Candidatus Tectomicrobia bacterium]|nr:tRNA (guanosine(46)-N7)-methyltransferase TrmB [Candidatus Tectomicrobia bacterium]